MVSPLSPFVSTDPANNYLTTTTTTPHHVTATTMRTTWIHDECHVTHLMSTSLPHCQQQHGNQTMNDVYCHSLGAFTVAIFEPFFVRFCRHRMSKMK
jgi:hypothetical protein